MVKVNKWLKAFKAPLMAFLKKKVVRAALKRVIGSAVMAGPLAFALSYVVEHLFEEFAQPLIDAAFRKQGYKLNIKDGEQKLERIENAENVDDWRDAVNKS